MIVLADASPLITLARAGYFDLVRELYSEVIISREVYEEVTISDPALPGAEQTRRAEWIHMRSCTADPPLQAVAACAGLGAGERSIIFLAFELNANLVLMDDGRARRAARQMGLTVAGSIAILERGASLGRVTDLRSVYLGLLKQGIRYDRGLLNSSLSRLGYPELP